MLMNTADRASYMYVTSPYYSWCMALQCDEKNNFMGAKKSLICEYGHLHISPVVAMSRKCAKCISVIDTDPVISAALEYTGSRNTAAHVSPTRRLPGWARSHFCESCLYTIHFTLEQVMKVQSE